MTFDPTKPVRTRDGREAEIIAVLPAGKLAYGRTFGCITRSGDGTFAVGERYSDGRCNLGREDVNDLINEPRKIKQWINVYPNVIGGYFSSVFSSRESADGSSGEARRRIACIEIEFEEGQGL